MKRLVIMLAFSFIPITVFADCRTYEYAELKDMSQQELEAEEKIVDEESLFYLKHSNNFLESRMKREYKETDEKFKKCDEQLRRIKTMLKKRFPAKE